MAGELIRSVIFGLVVGTVVAFGGVYVSVINETINTAKNDAARARQEVEALRLRVDRLEGRK